MPISIGKNSRRYKPAGLIVIYHGEPTCWNWPAAGHWSIPGRAGSHLLIGSGGLLRGAEEFVRLQAQLVFHMRADQTGR